MSEWWKNPDNVTMGQTCSVITGCLNHTNSLCKGGGFPCFAHKLANGRLKARYLANPQTADLVASEDAVYARKGILVKDARKHLRDPFYPRFHPKRLKEIRRRKKPTGYFLNIMGEWAGDWIPRAWQDAMFETIRACPQHRFYLLTKQYQNLVKFDFPDNCKVGITATADGDMTNAFYGLSSIKARVRFVSCEPLLGAITMKSQRILEVADGFIIGACTGTKQEMQELCQRNPGLTLMPYGNKWTAQPRIEWVEEIVEACDKVGVPVFLKDNLKPLLVRERDGREYAPLWANGGYGTLRQEVPKCPMLK